MLLPNAADLTDASSSSDGVHGDVDVNVAQVS